MCPACGAADRPPRFASCRPRSLLDEVGLAARAEHLLPTYRAAIVATHDSELAAQAPRRLVIRDGRLVTLAAAATA
jgi:ABC-type lipoprotein export system ATPase subunit